MGYLVLTSAVLLAGCLSAPPLLITARVQTPDFRTVLDRSGGTLLTLMIAAPVPNMVLAATTDSNHDDDEPHR